jgi:hypothetical protein
MILYSFYYTIFRVQFQWGKHEKLKAGLRSPGTMNNKGMPFSCGIPFAYSNALHSVSTGRFH